MVHIMGTQNTSYNKLINVQDVAILLIDHQTGLFQTVKDLEQEELRGNVIAFSMQTNGWCDTFFDCKDAAYLYELKLGQPGTCSIL